jgi:hypothetical protein
MEQGLEWRLIPDLESGLGQDLNQGLDPDVDQGRTIAGLEYHMKIKLYSTMNSDIQNTLNNLSK